MGPVVALGSAGLGLVWGWSLGLPGRRITPRLAVMAAAASLLVGLEVLAYAGIGGAAIFFAAAALAGLVHHLWHRSLRARFGTAGG